jgi:hypothetical protein
MSAATGFHPDQAGRQVRKKCRHLVALELLLQHDLSMLIYCVDLEYILCQIDANCRNLHDDAPLGSSGCSILPLWHIDAISRGGVHPIALSPEKLPGVQDFFRTWAVWNWACAINSDQQVGVRLDVMTKIVNVVEIEVERKPELRRLPYLFTVEVHAMATRGKVPYTLKRQVVI